MIVILVLFWFSLGFIFYIYLGYPLLVLGLSRLKPTPRFTPGETPGITLLIAAYNEEKVIAQKLENSLALDYPQNCLQILVAADGSDDKTVEIVKSFRSQSVELSYQPERRGKLAAIARAMGQVRGNIVVFSDANNMYTRHVLQALAAPFSDPQVGGVSGAKLILKDGDMLGEAEGSYWKYESTIKESESRLSSCVAISGEVWAARRELYQTPPEGIILDDFYMGMQIIKQGYRLVYAPAARSYEKISSTPQEERERRSRNIAGRYQIMALGRTAFPTDNLVVMWQVISHKILRTFLPFAMLVALISNLILVIFPVGKLSDLINLVIFFFQVLFYIIAWFGSKFDKSGSILGKMTYIPTFLVNSNIATLTGFVRFIQKRQSVLWQRASR